MLNAQSEIHPNSALGKQLVIELYDCNDARFDDIKWIEESMLQAAREANATIVTSTFHKFSPIGISGVVVIAESHLAIHTWPEYKYAAIDVFTCGDVLDGAQAVRVLSERLGSQRHIISSMDRGLEGHHVGMINRTLSGAGAINAYSPTLRWAIGSEQGSAR